MVVAIGLTPPMLGLLIFTSTFDVPLIPFPPTSGALSRNVNEIGARLGIDFFFCGTFLNFLMALFSCS